jgi:hypothetical protein
MKLIFETRSFITIIFINKEKQIYCFLSLYFNVYHWKQDIQKSPDVFYFQAVLITMNDLDKFRHTLFNINDECKMP